MGGDAAREDRDPVRVVLDRHAGRLLALPGVMGVAEGESGGHPCVVVLVAGLKGGQRGQVPSDVEGWPVLVRECGEFRALGD
jgi:hypothetical protein